LSPHRDLSEQRAFLVVRHGGRWSDVLRLSPDQPAIIGRSSSNAVTIRSHQASRRHAEVRWDDGGWWIRDLGSRNGTRVGGVGLGGHSPDASSRGLTATGGPAWANSTTRDAPGGEVARRLNDGDQIEIAGFSLLFVTRIADALALRSTVLAPGSGLREVPLGAPATGDDQLTIDGFAGTEITQRLTESRYLDLSHSDLSSHATGADPLSDPEVWPALFRLAYRVASSDSIRVAAELTLETLSTTVPGCFGGVFLTNKRGTDPADTASSELIAFQTAANRSYSRPTPQMVQSLGQGGRAILLRNLIDDSDLQAADSRGELSTQSAILAPILISRSQSSTAASTLSIGYLHLYTIEPAAQWTSAHLELAAAAAGVLGAAVDSLDQRGRLIRSLRRSRQTVDSLRQRVDDAVRIIGSSPPIVRLKDMIRRVAQTDSIVLVRGESGVGKELVAGAIHQGSDRRDGPLICLNCAALAPTLLESELFGHEKGAFTGATDQKKGKFEAADGGTLMLDEIGEMDINLQAKLLRVLEGHSFERVGGQTPLRVDVRVVAATNRDLAAEVASGRFRSDLYYRLNVVELLVPPLRDRGDDILRLAEHFISHFAEKTARVVDGLTRPARDAIVAHRWPGNVRELRNVIERAIVLGNDPLIDVTDLGLPIDQPIPPTNQHVFTSEMMVPEATPVTGEAAASPSDVPDSTVMSLESLERGHLVTVLRLTDGNKSRAASILGIERSTLDRKLKRYGLTRSAGW